MSASLPVLFISHGAPNLCLQTQQPAYHFYTNLFNSNAKDQFTIDQSKVKAILSISAHWEESVPTATASAAPEQIYDFYGFERELYSYKYAPQGDPALAEKVIRLVQEYGERLEGKSEGFSSVFSNAKLDNDRGLDHGTWSPISLMLPKAEIPIVQLSIVSGLDPKLHVELGKALSSLREEGVLIIASGSAVHNLGALNWRNRGGSANAEKWALEFDSFLEERLTAAEQLSDEDLDKIAQDFESHKFAAKAHPRTEHLAPIYVAAGAAKELRGTVIHRSFVLGSLSMTCFAFE